MKRGFGNGKVARHIVRAVTRKGGLASGKSPKHSRFTSEQAVEAGRLGGQRTALNREWMREIGRRGKQASMAAYRNRMSELGIPPRRKQKED